MLRRYLFLGFVCRFKNVSLDKDTGTFTRSNTETVSFFVEASPHRSASMAEESPQQIDSNGFVLTTLHGGGGFFRVEFLENQIVRFDENLAVHLVL